MLTSKFDLIFVTETWLNDTVSDGLLCASSDYGVYRLDRTDKKGGGVAIFYKLGLKLSKVELKDFENFPEILIADLSIKCNQKKRFMCCYRPPKYDLLIAETLCSLFGKYIENSIKCILLGDFNLPHLNFDSLDLPADPLTLLFHECFINLGLNLLTHEPTRQENLLDLIFSTSQELVFNITMQPPFCTSDHESISFCLAASVVEDDPTPILDFRKANYDFLAADLILVKWDLIFQSCISSNDFYAAFLSVLNTVISDHIPFKKPSFKETIPKVIRKLQSKKKKLWKRYKSCSNPDILKDYKVIVKKIHLETSKHFVEKEGRLLKSQNLQHFYKFVNQRLRHVKKIPLLVDENGKPQEADDEKANLLNRFFSSVFINDNGTSQNFPNRCDTDSNVLIRFDPETISNVMKNIKPSLSVGPDGICAFFFKKLHQVLCKPLSTIFEVSYRTGTLPDLWKHAIVIPIHKKGDASSPENYRPVSLCCIPCKIMENIINTKIMEHLVSKKLLTENQFGFRKNKSCALQLLKCKNIWSKNLDVHNHMDAIYIDFSKAFDTVSHEKLIIKLKAYGIGNFCLNWIKAFLQNRSQVVKFGGSFSNPLPVTSGVPQGSVLGPTLFLLFINDLCDYQTTSSFSLFADDVKITNQVSLSKVLQDDLNYVKKWSDTWQLKLSLHKCCVLHLGKSNPKYSYHIDDFVLPDDSKEIKDLGVYISHDLSSATHCNYIVKKAMRVANLILRCFSSKNQEMLKRAFVTYVRPILEYSSVVWNPHLMKDITALEKVQKRFTKRIFRNKTLDYDSRLQILKLEKLELRRLYTDLSFTFSIVRKEILPFQEFFQLNVNPTRASNSYKLSVNKFNLDIRKFEFCNRVTHIWNSLPETIVQSPNVKVFLAKLKQTDLSKYVRGRT